jgi:predicted HicB family RNase H-like nuclease
MTNSITYRNAFKKRFVSKFGYSLEYFQEKGRAVSYTSSKSRVTESITLRFDKDLVEKLRKEAQEKQISLNSLMGQIAFQHLDWHSHSIKAGFITVRKGKIMKMLEKISEKDIVEIAEYIVKRESKDFIMMLRNEYNITSALEVIETWIKIAGYSYRHDVRGAEHSFIIQHDMGKKWSLYLREQYRFIFEDFGLPRINFDVSETMLSFKVNIGTIFLS